ncbi:acyl-CoA dehydrogenase family protein [Actibacterium ureilyticum]|uniref:acyl-CoA dehydrogenase family protein n=1 Tax=Actibacterium ureilyticum TaxID=1590614 RepID=UPI000BAAA2CF|nr:acyl-CoA dehydrogenase family protein [Actibacterium ureilyticum]
MADIPNGNGQVLNQPEPPGDRDLWQGDPGLRALCLRFGGDPGALRPLAARLGQAATRDMARQAARNRPELHLFDRGGRRLDEVRFHPAYHDLLALGLGAGYAAGPWTGGSHVTHAAQVYLFSQVEPGVCCPMTMTYAAVPALAADAGLRAEWRPKLTALAHDPAIAPLADKRAATLGMAMTEKQGGSDVRSNMTLARPTGDTYRLEGHKWFCSAPMSDGFLTLAQAPGGLTCFLVPRWLPGDTRNPIHLMRLKDKLGNHANASAEIEYHGALAHRLGDEGAGIRTIIEMVHHTRLDTALAPAGLMKAALDEALWWCRGRRVFQRALIDQPLMRAVLADLVLDWAGALALGLRVAAAFDGTTPPERGFARVAVALAKFLSNKRAPNVIYECMEALGGMGYVEDTPLPMLYREAPLNSIWEGSGNVICLDILRSLDRDADAAHSLNAELEAARGGDAFFDRALADHRARWPAPPDPDLARWYVAELAQLLTGAVLLRSAPDAVAQGYLRTRLAGQRGAVTGAVDGLDVAGILSWADPHAV